MPSNSEQWRRLPVMTFLRRRFILLSVLLVLPLPTAAKGRAPGDSILYREGFLEVVSPDNMSAAQAREAAKKVLAAWKFDMNLMRWSNSRAMNGQLTLRLISDERMKRERKGSRAWAEYNGNRFNVRTGLINDPSINGTFAHELGHVQAFRALGKHRKSVRTYFLEGHGLILGQLYMNHLGLYRPENSVGSVRTLMSINAEEAGAILGDENYFKPGNQRDPGKEYRMEVLGLYFVEYMRVLYHGKGFADMVPRMALVFELVGRGRSYGQAFKETYGISPAQASSEIVAFFKRTEANPAERVKGTRFEASLPGGKSKK